MQYRLKKQDLKLQNIDMGFEQLKDELQEKLKEENNRLNIDNAKKRAMIQHVEYEQFEQIVLGANLKALKPNEILKLQELHKRNYQKQDDEISLDIKVNKNQSLKKENKEVHRFQNIDSFEDLKNFMKIYKVTGQKKVSKQQIQQIYKYWQNEENLEKVFGFDFDSEIFIEFIQKLFQDFCEDQEVQQIILQILILISKNSNFEMLIKISLTDYQIRFLKRISKQLLKKTKSNEFQNLIIEFKNIYEIN